MNPSHIYEQLIVKTVFVALTLFYVYAGGDWWHEKFNGMAQKSDKPARKVALKFAAICVWLLSLPVGIMLLFKIFN